MSKAQRRALLIRDKMCRYPGCHQTRHLRALDDANLARHLAFIQRRRQAERNHLAAVDSFQHPDAQTIRPRWAGEPFDLHACVQALFTIKLPKPTADLDQQAA